MRPETRDTAIAWREAQASANSEVFTKHETRDTNHGFLVLKPFSLFLPPRAAWHEDIEVEILPGMSHQLARRSPCGSRLRAFKAFTSH